MSAGAMITENDSFKGPGFSAAECQADPLIAPLQEEPAPAVHP